MLVPLPEPTIGLLMSIRLKKLTALFLATLLLMAGCTISPYSDKVTVAASEEAQLACKTYGRIEKEIVQGAAVSGMVIVPVLFGPLSLFVLPQLLMGLKPAIENDRKRDKIFEEALNGCLNPDTGTSDLIRIAGRRYYARKDYAEAEVLYRRALAIEAMLPHDEFRAGILEDYGQLMWVTERRAEGQEMLRRARSIRAARDQKKQTEANADETGKENRVFP